MPLPMSSPFKNINKRKDHFLIAIGTADYDEVGAREQLPSVRDDINEIAQFFVERLGYQHEKDDHDINPTSDQLRRRLGSWLTADERTSEDVVVLYYSGHGILAEESQRHYLFMHDSKRKELASTAFRTEEFFIMLEDNASPVVNFLLLLDACYSSSAAQIFSDSMQTISKRRKSKSLALHMIAATLPKQTAQPRFFSSAFIQAIEAKGSESPYDPFIHPKSLLQHIRDTHPSQTPIIFSTENIDATFISNPYFSSDTPHKSQKEIQQEHIRNEIDHHILHDTNRYISLKNDFKGRKEEIKLIHKEIEGLQEEGGYLVITGDAGQGKSSIIAKLLKPDQTAFHFVPFKFNANHKVSLLQKITYCLSEKYETETETQRILTPYYEDLCRYFHEILDKISAQNKKELIFLDGLDPLVNELGLIGDRPFLPLQPPSGIVFILGVQKDTVNKIFQIQKKSKIYNLQPLSDEDVSKILQDKNIEIATKYKDLLYESTRNTPLYLKLILQEIQNRDDRSQIDDILGLLAEPEMLFSLPVKRLGNKDQDREKDIKLILGLLMVSSEPLSQKDLESIISSAIAIKDIKNIIDALLMNGLIIIYGEQQYTLFHEKIRDYLLRDNGFSKEKSYYFMIKWCETQIEFIWKDAHNDAEEQRRRRYARRYYISHLYEGENWTKLFDVLKQESYGQAKLDYNLDTNAYIQDLSLGRKATMRKELRLEEKIQLLPLLWQYTLLECNLVNSLDQYTPEVFRFLIHLEPIDKVLRLIGSFKLPEYRVEALLLFARHLEQQHTQWDDNSKRMLFRAYEIAFAMKAREREFDTENNKIDAISDATLSKLSIIFTEAGLQEEAEDLINAIGNNVEHVIAIGKRIATPTIQRIPNQAAQIWQADGETLIDEITWGTERDDILRELVRTLAKVKLRIQAEKIIEKISDPIEKVGALRDLCNALIANGDFRAAEKVIDGIAEKIKKVGALRDLVSALIAKGFFEEAERVIDKIEEHSEKTRALQELGMTLYRKQLQGKAKSTLLLARDTSREIKNVLLRIDAIRELIVAMAEAQMPKEAKQLCLEHNNRVNMITGDSSARKSLLIIEALCKINRVLLNAKMDKQYQTNLKKAKRIAEAMRDDNSLLKATAFSELGKSMVMNDQHKQAEEIWLKAENIVHTDKGLKQKDEILLKLALNWAMISQWEHAETVLNSVIDLSQRSEGWQELGKLRAEDGINLEEAKKYWLLAENTLMEAMDDEERKDLALKDLSIVFVEAEFWDDAKRIVDAIKNQNKQTDALCELAIRLIKANQDDQAKKVISFVRDRQKRIELLLQLGFMLIETQFRSKAEKLWREIKNLLQTSVSTLESDLEQASESIAFTKSIEDFTLKKKYEEALDLIQNRLMKAKKKGEVLQTLAPIEVLLQRVKEDIANTPSIGVFNDASDQVDNFFRRKGTLKNDILQTR